MPGRGDIETERVLIGVTVGSADRETTSWIGRLERYFDLSLVDFVVFFVGSDVNTPRIPEAQWGQWARALGEKSISFAFLYTQQRGAPDGAESQLTPAIVEAIRETAGPLFLGDMVGECGGIASYFQGYFDGEADYPRRTFADLREAEQDYLTYVKHLVEVDRRLGIPAVFSVEATTFHRLNLRAGVDCPVVELMPGDPELMCAAARGASRAYGRTRWAAHVAAEWYGGFRNADPLKLKRLRLAYRYAFLAGAQLVYPESGHLEISSFGDRLGPESALCDAYRSEWRDFARFCRSNPRPVGGPMVSVGFVQGNLDPWTGWGGSAAWSQYQGPEWAYGDAERSWELLRRLACPRPWYDATSYGRNDLAPVPFGQYDLVPVESSPANLARYSCLVFLGWNTMTREIYEKLLAYVRQGGRLFMAVPHLSTSIRRGEEPALFGGGDCAELFGCIVSGRGGEHNEGVKFVCESAFPAYRYPWTADGACDPMFSAGPLRCAAAELRGARVLAVLADRFTRWKPDSPPILLEHSYGKGLATLLLSWSYPGAPCLSRFARTVASAMMRGEHATADVQVITGGRVAFAVFPDREGGRVVYLLNTDFDLPVRAAVTFAGRTTEREIGCCDLEVLRLDATGS